MYNNQPQGGYAPQGQQQQTGGQYEKNPNGGYLNPSNYGQDSWYGPITITPELLAEIQRTGKVLIEVKDVQHSQHGPCRRIVAKVYTPRQPQIDPNTSIPGQTMQHQAAVAHQQYAPTQAPAQPGPVAQPVYAQPAPLQPQEQVQQHQIVDDEIPF